MAAANLPHQNCPECYGYYLMASVQQKEECLKDIFNYALSSNQSDTTAKDILRYLVLCNHAKMIECIWSDAVEELLKDDCDRCKFLLTGVANSSQSSFRLLLEKGFLSALDHTCDDHPCSIREFFSTRSTLKYMEFFNIIEQVEEQCFSIKEPGI